MNTTNTLRALEQLETIIANQKKIIERLDIIELRLKGAI